MTQLLKAIKNKCLVDMPAKGLTPAPILDYLCILPRFRTKYSWFHKINEWYPLSFSDWLSLLHLEMK